MKPHDAAHGHEASYSYLSNSHEITLTDHDVPSADMQPLVFPHKLSRLQIQEA